MIAKPGTRGKRAGRDYMVAMESGRLPGSSPFRASRDHPPVTGRGREPRGGAALPPAGAARGADLVQALVTPRRSGRGGGGGGDG
jgi:hypothetical protein